jgi:hypothetical protein
MFIEKASATVAYGGGGTAVYFGLTAGEWQVVGVIGGILIGLAGLGVNAFFKHQHLKLARERSEAGEES